MTRLLLLACLFALAAMACASTQTSSSSSASTATSPTTVGAPGSTNTAGGGVDRSTPEAGARAFYDHLRAADCEGAVADLTTAVAQTLRDKAGGQERLCSNLREGARQIAQSTTLVSVTRKDGDAVKASVVLRVRDKVDHEDAATLSMTKEGESWKVSALPL